ncbi:MAG: hypothetical protein SPL08_00265 [Pseudomonadota bacterium]|nr:hypothetical protein [Pseudomonadota bacterium]
MNRKFFILALGLLTACQAPPNTPFRVIDYQNETPLLLPVGEVHITNQTTRYTELPHLETRIPISPVSALTTAFSHRFQPAFPQKGTHATIIIQEADLTQKTKESEHWYILDNIEYMLTYRIEVIYAQGSRELEHQHFSGWEKQALPKNSSLSQKERTWEKMINAMIQKSSNKIEADKPSIE